MLHWGFVKEGQKEQMESMQGEIGFSVDFYWSC